MAHDLEPGVEPEPPPGVERLAIESLVFERSATGVGSVSVPRRLECEAWQPEAGS